MREVDDGLTQGPVQPPWQGPGSGKRAWQDYAIAVSEANASLSLVIHEQRDALDELRAELMLLRKRVTERKPKGGRARTPDAKVARIERELRDKAGSTRSIAERYSVSPMTVSRIAKRMRERVAAVERTLTPAPIPRA